MEGKIEADKRDFPDLEPGQKVRISQEVDHAEYQKAKLVGTGKLAKGTAAKWSEKVYTIKKKVHTKPLSYVLKEAEGSQYRHESYRK